MEIRINPDYEKLLPKLPSAEYEALKESIRREGLHYPIIVNREGVILDGHNRYRACLELGIPVKYEVKDFGNPLIEKKFVIEANLRRRHLNDFQKAELAYPLLEIERELARQRQSEAGKLFGRGKGSFSSYELKLSEGQARDIVARRAGLSPTTFQRAVKIIEEAPERLKAKVRAGRMSITYAYKMLTRKSVKSEREGFKPELLNLWIFDRCDERFGFDYPGQVVQNLLWLYTDEGDLVVDPMAGSGTTIDVCKAMNRRCIAFDLNPCRDDIKRNDVLSGIPLEDESVDFVFLDPPYWRMKSGEYSALENDLANLTFNKFCEATRTLASESRRILRRGKACALLMGTENREGKFTDLTFTCYGIFVEEGFEPIERIAVNLGDASSINGKWRSRAEKYKFLLRGYKDLLVFRK